MDVWKTICMHWFPTFLYQNKHHLNSLFNEIFIPAYFDFLTWVVCMYKFDEIILAKNYKIISNIKNTINADSFQKSILPSLLGFLLHLLR